MKAFSLLLIGLFAYSSLFAGVIYLPNTVQSSSSTNNIIVHQSETKTVKKLSTGKLFVKVFKKKLNNITGFFKKSGEKSKLAAILLALFLGNLGVHDFYLGNKRNGFIKLGIYIVAMILYVSGYIAVYTEVVDFPVTLIIGMLLLLSLSIWSLIDAIRIGTGKYQPVDGYFRD